MYENKTENIPVPAVLACVDTGEFDAEASIRELEELASSAEAEVVGTVIQKRPSFDPATCSGSAPSADLPLPTSAPIRFSSNWNRKR